MREASGVCGLQQLTKSVVAEHRVFAHPCRSEVLLRRLACFVLVLNRFAPLAVGHRCRIHLRGVVGV